MLVWSVIVLVVMLMVLLQDFGATMTPSRDSTAVKWSHATNSREKLLEAVASDAVNFIEADILLGRTDSGLENVPIMAHPPDVSSNISFAEWIDIASRAETSKGLKLDFKDIDSVEPCLKTLQETSLDPDREIWLNADILDGPGSPNGPKVDRFRFLNLTRSFPSKHTLSIGWTTGPEPGSYTWKNVFDMIAVVEGVPTSTPITFPVRLSKLAFHPLALLMCLERNTSLTVWSSGNDTVSFEEVLLLHSAFPGKIFFDLPTEQAAELESEIERSNAVAPPRVSVVRSEMTTQPHLYSVITDGPGVITLNSERPSGFHWHRIDGDVKAERNQDATAPELLKQMTLRLTGSGRMIFYASP